MLSWDTWELRKGWEQLDKSLTGEQQESINKLTHPLFLCKLLLDQIANTKLFIHLLKEFGLLREGLHRRQNKNTDKEKVRKLAIWSSPQRSILTLFSANSFSLANLRLLSTQAAVSSSHGSSSPSAFTFLKTTQQTDGC